jgi:hypothetical protein
LLWDQKFLDKTPGFRIFILSGINHNQEDVKAIGFILTNEYSGHMTNVVYLNRSMSYVDLDSEYDPIKNIFYVSIQFYVKESLKMESDVPKKADRISICSLTCVLTLTSSNNKDKKEIIMSLPTDFDPIQTHISLGTNLNFYKQIDKTELEGLIDWRRGGDVSLGWSFYGNGLIDMIDHAVHTQLSYDQNLSFTPPRINENKWDSIIKKCRLDDKYLFEHSLSIPDSLYQKKNQFLNQMLSEVVTMSKYLNSAKDRVRKANSPSDYKAVIGDIKTSLDSIKNLQKSPTNAREFLVDSKTFIDIDVGGAEEAALDIIERLKAITGHIYQISSKAAHVQKAGLKFEMNPEREDALFLFEISVCILNYFIEKFKKLN